MLSVSRIATIAVFVGIGAIELLAAIDRPHAGTLSVKLSSDGTTSNNRFVVASAPAGSPLRTGDRIEIDDPGNLAAYQFQSLGAAAPFPVRRIDPPPEARIDVPVVPVKASRFVTMIIVIEALFLAIAILIVARGRSSGALSLAWPLVLMTTLVNPTSPAWPKWLILGFGIFGSSLPSIGLLCATDFATRFAGDPRALWARRFRSAAIVLATLAIVVNVAVSIDGFFEPASPAWTATISLATLFCQVAFFLISLVVAYVKAPPAERQRVSWVAASLGVGVVGFVLAVAASLSGVKEPLRDYPLLLTLAMPLGCAYAILRYRLLDIAFVVNRATVFGITSLLVLAALALVDLGLQNLLGSWLSYTGMYVQLGLALAIGIGTRPLHDWVDRVVDDVFFRQRHETERALRQFARDVTYIDDSKVVLDRTVETVARAAQLRCVLLLMTGDSLTTAAVSGDATALAPLDRNDGAVVRLLATREPVDLHQVDTELTGDFAFPMFARSRLIGVLVCSGKTDGPTAYAPDELDAIAAVAQSSGLALDLLRVEHLERELAGYRAGVPPRAVRGL
jgi:hypothetical protein